MRVALVAALVLSAAVLLRGQTIKSIQAAIENHDSAGAARMLAAALARSPRDAGLWNLQGVVHAQQSEMPAARAAFEKAVRLDPSLIPAWQNLARACQAMSDASAMSCAAAAWERVLRAQPRDTQALTSLATVMEWQGKFAESLRLLDKLPPDEATRSAWLALRCGDLAGLHRAPEAAAAAQRLAGATDFSETDAESILPVLEATHNAQLLVTLLEALDKRGQASRTGLEHLALAYEQLHRLPDARRTLERVAVADPQNTGHLLELARIAYLLHDYEGCLGYLGHARALTPKDARIHFLFGLVALDMQLPVEARRSLTKALALDPDNPDYNYAMGGVLLGGGNGAESVKYFARYVAKRPADPRGHFALGAAYFASLQYDKCRAEMLKIRNDPKTEAGADYFLGRVARVEEKFDEALADLNRSIQLAPSFAEAHTELARVYLAQNHLAEARAAIDRALKLDPDGFQANSVLLSIMQLTRDPGADKQATRLRTLDAERSRKRELMLRTIEVKPY